MFPIPFNFPFRKKDGSMTTISQAISEGGGSYTLPTASETTKGGIKVGVGLTMDGETLKNTNPTPYTLPTASAETLGGVKVGDGLSIDEGVLSVPSDGNNVYNHFVTIKNTMDSNKIIGVIGLVATNNSAMDTTQKLFNFCGLDKEIPVIHSEYTGAYTIKFHESGGTTYLYLGGSGYGFGQCNVSDVII